MASNGHPDDRSYSNRVVKTMVVDDQEIFRDVVRELVAATDGFMLVGEAGSAEEALSAVEELHPDLVVMDVRLPGVSGVEATGAMFERQPDLAVLLVSVYELTAESPRDPAGRKVPFVPKAALRTNVLQEVWEQHCAALR